MTPRQVYSVSGTVACLLLVVAGVAMPLSDLARLTNRYDAAASLEAAAAACMVVAILAVCFWFRALRQLKAGAPISIPSYSLAVVVVLMCFGLAVSLASGFSPGLKLALEFVEHCSLLVLSYLVWSMWKQNDAAQM